MHNFARAFLILPFFLAPLAACDSDVTDPTGGSGTGGASSGGSGTGGTAAGPCDGKVCGDPCSTCPEGAPCQQEACNANGECVGAEEAVCGSCPTEIPAEGSACPSIDLVCEMDDGPIVECRTRVTCTASGWTVAAPNCIPDPPPDPACPPAEPMGNCTVGTDPALCIYDTSTLCGCSDCLGGPCGGQAQWICSPAPEAPCPATAPQLGEPCIDEMLSCVYGSCAVAQVLAGRLCQDGVWVDAPVPCPL